MIYLSKWKFKPGDKLTRSVWKPDEFVEVAKVNIDNTFYDTEGGFWYKSYAESDWVLYED